MPTKKKKKRFWEKTAKPQKAFEHAPAVKSKEYNSRAWQRTREAVLNRDMKLCQHCKAEGFLVEATVADHITPVNQGGEFWDQENIQSLCASCHNRKSARERWKK